MKYNPILALLAAVALLAVPGCTRAPDDDAAPGPVATVETPHGPMVQLPGGSFTMGSSRRDDEQPTHTVTLDPFLIDQYEVTQANFLELMGKDLSHFKGEDLPVEQVSWADAAFYCNARSRAEGLEPCYDEDTGHCDFNANGYHLPTEAQWEYAARAGSSTTWHFGDDPRQLPDYAWFEENSNSRTHPVGQRKPNLWGIHDMYGNVMEWCNDPYEPDYYANSPAQNPLGPPETPQSRFVLRGGAWNRPAEDCRSARRFGEPPGRLDGCFGRDDLGFRCARKLPADQAENPDPANPANPTN